MKVIIKSLFSTALFFMIMQFASAQTTIKNSPLGNQFQQIFDNAPTGYKKLRTGIGEVNNADTVFISSVQIPGTQKSTIKVNKYGKTYIILVAEGLADTVVAKTSFEKWSSDIQDALGIDFIKTNRVYTNDGYTSVTDIFLYRVAGHKKKSVRLIMSSYENHPADINIDVTAD